MRRRQLILVIFTIALSFFSPPAQALDAPVGQVVLTVTGDITETNRGAYDAKADLFIKHHERTFKKAAALDLGMLEGLGMEKFRIGIPGDKQARIGGEVDGLIRMIRSVGGNHDSLNHWASLDLLRLSPASSCRLSACVALTPVNLIHNYKNTIMR
ncbi:MAG: hypothetical protein O3A84_09085 [Proteobacteria bacterium]|nr:hypothetical protein [Pseudomonadota bacterium]